MDALLEIFTTLETIDYIASKGIHIIHSKKICWFDDTKKMFRKLSSAWSCGSYFSLELSSYLSVTPIIDALMAGNTVVIKPSEVTPILL